MRKKPRRCVALGTTGNQNVREMITRSPVSYTYQCTRNDGGGPASQLAAYAVTLLCLSFLGLI